MGILRTSADAGKSQALLNEIWAELLDMDEHYAHSFLDWCLEKARMNKDHFKEINYKALINKLDTNDPDYASKKKRIEGLISKAKHKNLPIAIQPGDIVSVKFGVNVGFEFADLNRDLERGAGHFAIVVRQFGFMFWVVPLSSQDQRLGTNYDVCYADLQLPGNHTNDPSYVALNKMKCIHIRRIGWIHGLPGGKKPLEPEQFEELKNKIAKFAQITT